MKLFNIRKVMVLVSVSIREARISRTFFGRLKASRRRKLKKLIILENTGCPKSSFLYFISLYFSTIGLGKEKISTKVVSFNIIHYFHTFCATF